MSTLVVASGCSSSRRRPSAVSSNPTPVSQSDKVNVKIALDPEPNVKDWEQRRGLVGWERSLKPNETARFKVDYVIDYPKEGSVQGL